MNTVKTQTIHLTEIAVSNFPESQNFKYKCRIILSSNQGEILLEKELLTRLQPHWLLDIKHQEHCQIKIELLYREGEIINPWQLIGNINLSSQEIFKNNATTGEIELLIETWNLAPELKIKVNLTQGITQNNVATLNLFAPSYINQKSILENEITVTETQLKNQINNTNSLSVQDEVMLRDLWHRLMVHKDLSMEMFWQRLIIEEAEIEFLCGDFIEGMTERFYGFFNLCIYSLQPQTNLELRSFFTGSPLDEDFDYKTREAFSDLFADIGLRAKHWVVIRRVWMWTFSSLSHFGDEEQEDFTQGENSALYRFFNLHIIKPILDALDRYDQALTPEMLKNMGQSWEIFSENKQQKGLEFYQTLFAKYPQVLPLFGRADIDYLSIHLFQSLDFLINCLKNGEMFLNELRELGRLHGGYGVPPYAYNAIADCMFVLFERHVPNFNQELKQAWLILFNRVANVMRQPKMNEEHLLKKAKDFLDLISKEQAWEVEDYTRRWEEIKEEVKATGTYTQSYEELAYGAQVAWRNSAKCIGRIQWSNLMLRDRRDVTDADQIFLECEEHLKMGTNEGNLQIVMTVFRPRQPKERWGIRIWNPQLVRYAAYELEDGKIMGDGANLALTKQIIKLGWQPPEPKTPYDILPLIIEVPGQQPKLYEFDKKDILEVEIEHPTIPQFKNLNLKWYAIPAIANFRLSIGGIDYSCCPFNGWYMDTEVVRDFAEESRYDKLEEIAHLLGIDTTTEQTLWRDRAFLDLNLAVVHSFEKAKVTMVDHQNASQQFLTHNQREQKAGRECPAEWSWVVPPFGGSTCPVWHRPMRDFYLEPQYHYAADKWAVEDGVHLEVLEASQKSEEQRQDRILILYGSETGTAEGFARQGARKLKAFSPKVMALDDYDCNNLAQEKLLLIVTSTFGNGEMPGNGKKFFNWLKQQEKGSLKGLNYSIMAIGSTVYEKFCAAGIALDKILAKTGANCIVPLHKADQIKGQAETFNKWLGLVSRIVGEDSTSSTVLQNEIKLNLQWLKPEDLISVATIKTKEDQGLAVPVIANTELLQEVVAGSRSTRYLEFDISESNLSYETGDHVAVYPHNPTELVNRLCEHLKVNPHAYFTANYQDHQGNLVEDESLPFNLPITVKQVLTENYDLAIQEPFDDLIAYFHHIATEETEKKQLANWLEILKLGNNNEQCLILKKEITDNYLNLVELLEAFPSVQITLASIIELLPKQKPRLYSISSSPLLHPHKIMITVGVLQVKTDANKTRQGLCSNYLANLNPGETVGISVRTSNFRPPQDPDAVMLMVGPGTGVSPLIAFLQYRQALLGQNQSFNPENNFLGESCLYFGCRNYSDFLYQQQLETWLNQGVLSNLEVAFSRLGEQKVYVQNLMAQQPEKIWTLLSNPKCHYYVCGDAKMADDVFEVLMNITKTQGNLSHLEMRTFFDKMKKENRFYTDVWGVTLNYQDAMKQVQKDKYSKAEKWLNRVKDTSV